MDANNQAKHDYAKVRGFVDGVSQLIQDAVELTYIKPLSHVRYGFNDVWPEQYLDHLLNVWCPLDAAAAREVKAHYERGWDRANGELLATFAERLDQEQASLQQDGVTIHADDKFTHYITEVLSSGEFSETIIIEWTQQPNQNYATARAFFEGKMVAIQAVRRLTGNNSGGLGLGTALSAQEIEELRAIIKEAVRETVAAAIEERERNAPANTAEYANALQAVRSENMTLKEQMQQMTLSLLRLTTQLNKLHTAMTAAGVAGAGDIQQFQPELSAGNGGGGGGGGGGGRGGAANQQQHTWNEQEWGAWSKNARPFPKEWSRNRKFKWYKEYERRHPAEYKAEQRAKLQKQLADLGE